MLSESEIKRFIDDDVKSEQKKRAQKGERYYDGIHDILQCRMFFFNADGNLVEDKFRSNSKIPHPFFTEITDQLAAYMLSFDKNPIRAKDAAEDLQEKLDQYFDDEFWGEVYDLLVGTCAKGFEYLYGYKDVDNRLHFQCADSIGVVEVRAKDTDDQCDYVIYWYVDRVDKGKKEIRRIQVWDNTKVTFFVQAGTNGPVQLDDNVSPNPSPHVLYADQNGQQYGIKLGYIPFWRLDYDRKRRSGLTPIKALIDDYDLMECGLSNNLKDFDNPLYVVKGFEGDNLDELQQNLKTKKIVGVDGSDGSGIDVKTVDVPYQARIAKLTEDEKNIYRFGMGFNSSQSGDGNITNVVIRSRYTLLDLKANKLEMRLRKFLKPIIKIVLDEINEQEGTAHERKDVYMQFDRIVPTNEQENAQNDLTRAQAVQTQVNTVLNAAASIGDEEVQKAICDLLDLDYDEVKSQVESQCVSTGDVQTALDQVAPDE